MATPIGHLGDLSRRACDVLRDVRLVAAEDTRHTRQLLQHIGSDAELISAHAHNERSRIDQLTAVLSAGDSCALVSDAGTPAISDPGARLVGLVRAAGYKIVPIPGPSSVVTLLSVAGLDADRFGPAADRFQFEGFLPAKPAGRRKRLTELSQLSAVLVLMEAPHRIAACLDDLLSVLGPERIVVIGRELTKRFEQIVSVTTAQAPEWLASDSNHSRGEFVLAIAPPALSPDTNKDISLSAESPLQLSATAGALMQLLLTEMSPARAARLAKKLTGLPGDALYELAVSIQNAR